MHPACKRLLAFALCASVVGPLGSSAVAAGVVVTMAPAGVAAPGSAAAAVNWGAWNAPATSLQGSRVLSLSPALAGGMSVQGVPKVSAAVGQAAVVPTGAEAAWLPAAAAPAAMMPIQSVPDAAPAQADAQRGVVVQDLIAAPDAAVAAKTPSHVSAQKQLERLAKETPQALAKEFDGRPAGPEAVDAAPDAGTASAGQKFGKLGRLPTVYDSRTLPLAKYILPQLPGAPSEVDFSAKVKDWGMMLNDKLGCCTIAAPGHEIQQWTANAGSQQTPPDSSILSAYEAVSGYRPGSPETDRGANMLDVLKYWRKTGIAGHKIGAFASMDPSNLDHIRAAVWIFGSAYLGIGLPISAQKQDVWDVPAGGAAGDGKPGSWGGHAVEVAGFSPKGVFVVTWGGLKLMTWNFFKTYVEEAYAIISQDFLKDGKTPNNGLDLATLKADLKTVTDDRPEAAQSPGRR